MRIKPKRKHNRKHTREQNLKHDDKKTYPRCNCRMCAAARKIPSKRLDLHDQEDD